MYYLQVQVVLLYGICHVYGFFHFTHEDFLFDGSASYNISSFRSDPILWIEQPVDHFNKSDQRAWKQKYYKIMDSWKPGGPILLYINGETELQLDLLGRTYLPTEGNGESFIREIVEETSAAYIMLEHRYYGTSLPFDNLTTENFAFLTSRQALADIEFLLLQLKEEADFKNSKVIVIGGSYAGNLAAWMKLMYPTLVDAVLSSSAPVLAKKDFNEYFEVVTDTFKTYGSEECVTQISANFSNLQLLLQTPEGIKKLKEENNICENDDMTVPENQQHFFMSKVMPYAELSQYGDPGNISKYCKSSNLKDIKHLIPKVWKTDTGCETYDFYKNMNVMPMNYRSWDYQICTEFGYFQSISSSKQMFGNILPVDYYYKKCKALFGEEFNEDRVDEGVKRANEMYKGLNPNVEHVVFVNGDMDPWHSLGILHDLSADAPALYLKGSSHCHELKGDPNDTDDLKEARERIKNLLKKWIGVE